VTKKSLKHILKLNSTIIFLTMNNTNTFKNTPLPSGYEIREAYQEDAEGIAFVHTMAWKTAYKGILNQAFLDNVGLEERLTFRQKILRESKGLHYVALWKNKVIGFCDAHVLRFHENQHLSADQRQKRTERGEIYALYLLRDHQHKGIGKALFQRMRLQLKEEGLIPFLAWVFKDNHQARQFYESQGGILVDEVSARIGDQDYQEVAYRFEE
jgi:GNAT superfamily N-acetyltransferase